MSDRRDNLLLASGILIGLGAGLCIGVGLSFVGVFVVVHHMFVPGAHHWLKFMLVALMPAVLFVIGLLMMRFARRKP